jgi:hypothetical protein
MLFRGMHHTILMNSRINKEIYSKYDNIEKWDNIYEKIFLSMLVILYCLYFLYVFFKCSFVMIIINHSTNHNNYDNRNNREYIYEQNDELIRNNRINVHID